VTHPPSDAARRPLHRHRSAPSCRRDVRRARGPAGTRSPRRVFVDRSSTSPRAARGSSRRRLLARFRSRTRHALLTTSSAPPAASRSKARVRTRSPRRRDGLARSVGHSRVAHGPRGEAIVSFVASSRKRVPVNSQPRAVGARRHRRRPSRPHHAPREGEFPTAVPAMRHARRPVRRPPVESPVSAWSVIVARPRRPLSLR